MYLLWEQNTHEKDMAVGNPEYADPDEIRPAPIYEEIPNVWLPENLRRTLNNLLQSRRQIGLLLDGSVIQFWFCCIECCLVFNITWNVYWTV